VGCNDGAKITSQGSRQLSERTVLAGPILWDTTDAGEVLRFYRDFVREAYGDSVYDRLVDVKTTYDPENVFHHNQNIKPTG
jgi:hypothetical protein